MSKEKLNDWRNKPVIKECKNCGKEFEWKYNSTSCGECRREIKSRVSKKFHENNPSYWRKWANTEAGIVSKKKAIARSYSTTVEHVESIRQSQGGACAICGMKSGWIANGGGLVIDHCHKDGNVRGLLCQSCNRGLGQFLDNPAILRSAADYIDKRKKDGRS